MLISPLTGRKSTPILRSVAVIVACIALADLAVIALRLANGIDWLVLPFWADRLTASSMSVATATSLFLVSCCAILQTFPPGSTGRTFTILASIGLLLPSIAIVGHLFDTHAVLEVFVFATMAIHTAVLLVLLYFAMMLRSRGGWLWLLFGDKVGSVAARRLFPTVVLGPFLFCLLTVLATDAGLMSANFRITLLAILTASVGLIAIVHNAQIENAANERQAELLAELRRTVADKNLLIREIHHRVKNNLQQITALIAIEAAKYRGDERAPFDALSGRVQALGLVHQLLMQSSRQSEISVATFLTDLCDSISRSHFLLRRNIALEVEVDDEDVLLECAVTIGLLANELVTNSIKHAFGEQEGGSIRVSYRADQNNRENRLLVVQDSGRGIDAQELAKKGEGGGMRIIRSLVAQLRGKMDMQQDNGTRFAISFPSMIFEETRYVV